VDLRFRNRNSSTEDATSPRLHHLPSLLFPGRREPSAWTLARTENAFLRRPASVESMKTRSDPETVRHSVPLATEEESADPRNEQFEFPRGRRDRQQEVDRPHGVHLPFLYHPFSELGRNFPVHVPDRVGRDVGPHADGEREEPFSREGYPELPRQAELPEEVPHTGAGTASRISERIASPASVSRSSPARNMRWQRTAGTVFRTSLRVTKSLPERKASAWEVLLTPIAPRRDAPSRTKGCCRVASTIRYM
jgi:hypothetical protein